MSYKLVAGEKFWESPLPCRTLKKKKAERKVKMTLEMVWLTEAYTSTVVGMSWPCYTVAHVTGLLSKLARKKKKKIYYNQGLFGEVSFCRYQCIVDVVLLLATSLLFWFCVPHFTGAQSVGHEVVTYEDVVKLMPDTNRRRPIVLIGWYLFLIHTCGP